MTADEEKLADSAAGTTLIGSQPVSRLSTTRGGSTWKRGTTKPVEDEESAPVSAPDITKLPKLFSGSYQLVSLLFISSSHFPNISARWCKSIVRALKQPDRAVNVKIEPMRTFLHRDGNLFALFDSVPLFDLSWFRCRDLRPSYTRLVIHSTYCWSLAPSRYYFTSFCRSIHACARFVRFQFVFLFSLQVYVRSSFNLKIVVDSALQVIDVYQSTILELDKVMLLKPKMSTVHKRVYSYFSAIFIFLTPWNT